VEIIAAVGLEKCSKNSDCTYEGGVCWLEKECSTGTCLCDREHRLVGKKCV